MKLVIYYLNKIDNVEVLQIIVFLFFFALFLFIAYNIIRGNKKLYTDFGNLPLENDIDINNSKKIQ